jgi:hypothetical protein
MQENVAYIRPKVVRLFPGPCASGCYVHRATLLLLYACRYLLCLPICIYTYAFYTQIFTFCMFDPISIFSIHVCCILKIQRYIQIPIFSVKQWAPNELYHSCKYRADKILVCSVFFFLLLYLTCVCVFILVIILFLHFTA